MNSDSILVSVKKMMGIEPEYTHFDTDLILHTNSVLMTLTQIGIGPAQGFAITGTDETWQDLLGERKDLEGAKSYIYIKVRLVFDPPTSSFVIESLGRTASEIEWRLNVQVEGGETNGGQDEEH